MVFKAPPTEPCAEDECEYIKRIIGMPGDRVKVEDGKVYLNGSLLVQDFLPSEVVTDPGSYCRKGLKFQYLRDNIWFLEIIDRTLVMEESLVQ